MDYSTTINLLGFLVLVIVNIVVVSSHHAKIRQRMEHVEKDIESLKKTDDVHATELKAVIRLEGKIDTLLLMYEQHRKL